MYGWDWRVISLYKVVFWHGAIVTLELTCFALIVGTSLGVLFAYLKHSKLFALRICGGLLIELFRTLPILVVIIWIFYAIPILFSWKISPFLAAGLALSFHLAGFVAETIRAAVESIPRSQFESAMALGMNNRQTVIHIIAPQAIRNMIPNLLGLYINELKNSSLASIIAVNELLHQANVLISDTFRPLEVYSTVAAVYLIIILPFIFLAKWFERRITRPDHQALNSLT